MAKKKSAAAKRRAQEGAAAASAAGAAAANGPTNGHHHDSSSDDEEHVATNGNTSTSSPAPNGTDSPSTSIPSFNFNLDSDAGMTPSQRAEKYKTDGNAKFKAGEYQASADLYSKAIEQDSEEPSYYTNRAAALISLKRHALALSDCQRAAALQASAPQAKTLARLARCQIALGQIDDASRTVKEVLTIDGKNAQGLADQARIERIRTDLSNVTREKAKKEWTYVMFGLDSLEKEVDTPPIAWRVIRVEALLGKKRLEDAGMLASDLIRMNQADPDVLWVRGLVLFAQGNTAQTVAHCQSALRNDPDHSPARLLLKKAKAFESNKETGNDLFKRGQWQQAIDKYTECLDTLEPEHEALRITLLSNRATAYLKAGSHDSAVADSDVILSSQPKHFKALRTRARAYFALEQFESAIADFAAAFQEAPAGSAEERAMKTEHRQAEVALKRSKSKDYYKILEVERTATDVEIKKAYRRQSLLHHPDKGGSEDKFKDINEAYSILSDSQKRRRYDLGEDDDDMMGGGGFPGGGFHSHASPFGGGGFGGSPFGGGGFGDGGIDLEDLLGGGGGRSRRGGGGFSYQFG